MNIVENGSLFNTIHLKIRPYSQMAKKIKPLLKFDSVYNGSKFCQLNIINYQFLWCKGYGKPLPQQISKEITDNSNVCQMTVMVIYQVKQKLCGKKEKMLNGYWYFLLFSKWF